MKVNLNKTVSAQQDGIIISYRESNKYQFLAYQDKPSDLSRPRYQQITKPVFNKVQQKLYAQTVYGLGHYPKEQVSKMPDTLKDKIVSRHKLVQLTLNRWKQELVYASVDGFLSALFPKSKTIEKLCSVRTPDNALICNTSFKELGLDQTNVAEKLVEEGLLPNNFFQLGLK